MGLNFCSEPVVKTVRFTVMLHMIMLFKNSLSWSTIGYYIVAACSLISMSQLIGMQIYSRYVEETINVRTSAIIGRSYTETKPRRYWVCTCILVILLLVKKNHHRNAGMHDW